jgi:predicted PolB exonuclease-like 3'-5' exonuclease
MMDDFNSPEPYRKGKSKVIELKAWQSRQGDKISVSKFRCWDGNLGCEQFKGKDDFKWHPRLCNACTAAISTRFGVKQSEMEMLGLLLSMDAGLFRSVVYLKAPTSKVEALRAGQEMHVKHLMDSINKDQQKIKTLVKSYTDWFYAQCEIEITKPSHASGFTSLAAAVLPVGDRA